MSPTFVLLNISPWGDGGLLLGIGADIICLGCLCQGFHCRGSPRPGALRGEPPCPAREARSKSLESSSRDPSCSRCPEPRRASPHRVRRGTAPRRLRGNSPTTAR